MLGVSVETLRRWETEGRLTMERSEGGQRLVDIEQVSRLLAERRRSVADRPIVAQSARNRFAGIVTRVERDGVAAVVEVIAGPHRLVSLMTAEAVEELDLKVGDEAVCVVKATNVIVEIPSVEGSAHHEGPPAWRPPAPCVLVLAACSSGAASRAERVPSAARTRCRPAIGVPRSRVAVTAAAVDLTVYGAASLKGALAEARPAYEAANPGVTLTISTDASSTLATQIEQGAPADVFLSADSKNPQALVDAGLATAPPVTFASNKLTVIVPAANPAGIRTPADLAKSRRQDRRGRGRGADHEVRQPARREPRQGSPATRQISRPPTTPTSCPRRTTSGRWSPRSSSARAMRGSST